MEVLMILGLSFALSFFSDKPNDKKREGFIIRFFIFSVLVFLFRYFKIT